MSSRDVAILTGGGDRPYALGLASSLIAEGIAFDFIAGDDLKSPELDANPLVRFLNLRGSSPSNAPLFSKFTRILRYYIRLLRYASSAEPGTFHILWNNKFEYFDRTFLLVYYRLLGKRLVYTVHNVNIRKRDGKDSALNRLTLRAQYQLVDHLFVHTEQMKVELGADFAVPADKISVIPFGINNTVPDTALTPAQARERLGLADADQVLLFFGNIAPYKGLEYLVEAIALIATTHPAVKLVIAGRTKSSESYWTSIERRIVELSLAPRVIQRIEFVPDADTEVYFKAADVLVLPYTHVFQSGVLFLGYNFGIPTIAADVGSLKDDILDGSTGFVCRPRDPEALADAIRRYLTSNLYKELALHRPHIRDFARRRYSWSIVGEVTKRVYARLKYRAQNQDQVHDTR